MSYLEVRHNIEVAHRLFDLKGKCEAIHGHSMWVTMRLHGHINTSGVLEGLDFGGVKKHFREYLDTHYDHKLLLNEKDPFAQLVASKEVIKAAVHPNDEVQDLLRTEDIFTLLPGLVAVPGDPTTENIARWVAKWSVGIFGLAVDVHVQETHVNGAGFSLKGYRNGS